MRCGGIQRPSCGSTNHITDAKPNADTCESSTAYLYLCSDTRGFAFFILLFLFPSVNICFDTAINGSQKTEGAERQTGWQAGSNFREKGRSRTSLAGIFGHAAQAN